MSKTIPSVEPLAAALHPSWTRLAGLEELDGDGPFALSAGGHDLVVLRTPTGFKAYEGRCPHQGALLGEGEYDGETLVCRNHRWRFEAATGKRRDGPECLVACPVQTRGGALWADVAPLERPVGDAVALPHRRLEDLPGPRGLPVLGNMHQLTLSKLHLQLEAWAAEYGPIYLYRFASQRVLTISEPRLMEAVLRDRPETFRRSSNVWPVFKEMGVNGVFSAEGAVWRPQRRLAMHALSHRNLRGFYPALRMIAGRLRRRWQDKADAGVELDMVDELKRFTVDITTLLAFGHDVDTIGQEGDLIQRRLELVFPAFNRRLFAPFPIWRWIRMPQDRRLDRALAELRTWLSGLIGEARARLEAEPERAARPENLLESMLAARDEEGRPFADEVIFGNAMTMLLAGEDTTAFTLAWAVHELCDSPGAVARLAAEAELVLGGEAAPAEIEAANQLLYAGAVANETMRLRPVAPVILLEARQDAVIGDLAVPRGTWVAVLTRPAAMQGGNFVDPGSFRPERWLDAEAAQPAMLPHDPSAHLPFGSGPRICPGRTLALLEMKVLLAMLYQSFEVERVGRPDAVREEFAFTMGPANLRVRLRRRESDA
jgi:cytochrome P450/nitrite reductase/ring-hydroxylating ferredoxin subunit